MTPSPFSLWGWQASSRNVTARLNRGDRSHDEERRRSRCIREDTELARGAVDGSDERSAGGPLYRLVVGVSIILRCSTVTVTPVMPVLRCIVLAFNTAYRPRLPS
jgi:hypothetical protein